ncbi:hypothetical protein BCR36DRAFT_118657 [Piromyces finnis]|uniref:Uncharacterized protein n=1 Tax=Piromyces finnis TaxID=1754191 RepID=A0A1Y1V2W8_9FUNG|nr:hypothetical protein BCR36DRAFT_118657 [Piromyces finnis]|eukprot:ORX45158.1 hypothetical protein BCR36DRAFT_118657 [Piromyces finnis]
MKYHKIWKFLAYVFFIYVIGSKVFAQDTNNKDENIDNNNTINNDNNSNNDEDNPNGDEEIDPECSSNIGNILFQKPDSKR